tara:strand:+ start:843 stop:1379 length:537 start_codon:yes stop_codon:yes gene_type:complete
MLDIELRRNFDFTILKKNTSKMFKEFEKTNIDDVVGQLKENIREGKYFDTELSPMTKSVRRIRGIASNKPLIESGEMISSIKVKSGTKGGRFQVKKYGVMQNDGYLVNDGQKHAFYAPNKRAKSKRLYKINPGTKVPARPWLIYKPKKKQFNLFMSKFMKYIRTPMMSVKTTTFKLDI